MTLNHHYLSHIFLNLTVLNYLLWLDLKLGIFIKVKNKYKFCLPFIPFLPWCTPVHTIYKLLFPIYLDVHQYTRKPLISIYLDVLQLNHKTVIPTCIDVLQYTHKPLISIYLDVLQYPQTFNPYLPRCTQVLTNLIRIYLDVLQYIQTVNPFLPWCTPVHTIL